jgi:hypothetical protein
LKPFDEHLPVSIDTILKGAMTFWSSSGRSSWKGKLMHDRELVVTSLLPTPEHA